MSSENLWPDFDLKAVLRTPRNIVMEAGEGLTKKTNGLVRVLVEKPELNDGSVSFTVDLHAVALGYKYPFMMVSFPMSTLYPAVIYPQQMGGIQVASQEELLKALAKVFNEKSTVDIIQKLMQLSR